MIIPQRVQIIFIVHLDVSHGSPELADLAETPREAIAVGRQRGVERRARRHVRDVLQRGNQQRCRLLALRRERACVEINQ